MLIGRFTGAHAPITEQGYQGTDSWSMPFDVQGGGLLGEVPVIQNYLKPGQRFISLPKSKINLILIN